MGRALCVAAAAGGCLLTYSVYKAWRVLAHYEPVYQWIGSIIPPSDYDYRKEDTKGTADFVKEHHPALLDMVERGTLDVLTRPAGYDRPLPEELYILGTAHVSRQTANDVHECILQTQPEAVVVELCRGRSFMMFRDPEKERQVSQASTIMQACRQGQNIMQILIGLLYMRVEESMKTVAGLEFIRAQQAISQLDSRLSSSSSSNSSPAETKLSRKVQVYLGDVGLQQTLSRSWGVLSVRQKLKLAWTFLWDLVTLDIDEKQIEELLKKDVLASIQDMFGVEYAPMLGPLLHERNWSLAATVHRAAQHGNSKRVLMIVGKGHVPGIVYCLLHPWRAREQRRREQQQQRAAV